MAKSKMPKFDSLTNLVEFFDTHDMGDYLEDMREVDSDINITKRTHLIALDEDLAQQVTAIAKAKRVSSKNLVNQWLREKVLEQAKAR